MFYAARDDATLASLYAKPNELTKSYENKK